jgi:sensor histidine kinase regulating citrate/malate metabolism
MGFLRTMKSKSEIRRLTRQLADAKQEVSQLRTMSLKDQ